MHIGVAFDPWRLGPRQTHGLALHVDLGPFEQETLGSGGLVQKDRHGSRWARDPGGYTLLIVGKGRLPAM